jgi:hypothetical protein
MALPRRLPSAPWAIAFGLAAGLSGCATTARGPAAQVSKAAVPRPVVTPSADANGTWDWVLRSTDDQGDMRVEQEEWHLVQHGSEIEGYYDRAVTMMSTDERLFRCNQKLGFTKTTRVRISGRIEGEHVLLREVGFEATPGPCDDGARNLVAYEGVLENGSLALRWGTDAGQTLIRRMTNGNGQVTMPQASSSLPMDGLERRGAREVAASPAMSVPIEGRWVWELRSIDADGDERTEREEWHISETTDGIRGYYDRMVRRVRAAGTFSCSGEPSMETATRYTITGQRFGDRVNLTELDYKAKPSRCDNALRRLDRYQGQIADSDSLILSWGPGNQLLRRQH